MKEVFYNIKFAELWSYSADSQFEKKVNITDTCQKPVQDFGALSFASAWIFSFGLNVIGLFAFQLLSEEKGKRLISSLRRLGLFESAYWFSWFVTFQSIIIIGAILAVIFCRCVHSIAYPLDHAHQLWSAISHFLAR